MKENLNFQANFLPLPPGRPEFEREVEIRWPDGTFWKKVPIGILMTPDRLIVPPGQDARIWSADLVEDSNGKERKGGICVVRAGGIGDLILLSSTLKGLRERHKTSRITLATKKDHKPLFEAVGYLDEVIDILDLERLHYEKTIDLRGVAEPKELGLGFGKGSWTTYTKLDRSDIFDRACKVRINHSQKNFSIAIRKPTFTYGIALIISNTSPTRQIPPQYIKEIAKRLYVETGKKVYLVGQTNPENKFLAKLKMKGLLNYVDKLPLTEFIKICASSELIISPDSAAVHIGGAYNIPTLALFGNIDPKTRISYYKTVEALYAGGKFKCCPCWEKPERCRDAENWREGTKCMRYFTPSMIVKKAKEMLKVHYG